MNLSGPRGYESSTDSVCYNTPSSSMSGLSLEGIKKQGLSMQWRWWQLPNKPYKFPLPFFSCCFSPFWRFPDLTVNYHIPAHESYQGPQVLPASPFTRPSPPLLLLNIHVLLPTSSEILLSKATYHYQINSHVLKSCWLTYFLTQRYL